MAEESKPGIRTISKEELAAIMVLPVREFKFGGVQKRGRYDEESHKFYFMNDEGKLIGRIATVTFHDKAPMDAVPSESKAPQPEGSEADGRRSSLIQILRKLAGSSEAEINGIGSQQEKPPNSEKKARVNTRKPNAEEKQKRKLLIGAALALFMLLLCVIIVPSIIRNSVNGTGQAGSGGSIENPTQNVSSLDAITVIQVTRDLIPGDILSSEDLQSAVISAAEYNLIYTGSSPLYQWSRCEDLLEMRNYVTEYIPKGLYLTYDNVSGVYPQTINPWMQETLGVSYVSIPLSESVQTDTRLTYGAILDITIQKSSQHAGSSQGEENDVDGMKVTIVREDRVGYTLQNAWVCDLLDSKGESLYARYSHLMAIPSGEQVTYLRNLFLSDSATAGTLSPQYIVVGLTTAQAKELGNLNSSGVSIKISLTDRTDTGTDAKLRFSEGAKVLLENITLAIQRTSAAETEAMAYAG